jgi:hypothetical protein
MAPQRRFPRLLHPDLVDLRYPAGAALRRKTNDDESAEVQLVIDVPRVPSLTLCLYRSGRRFADSPIEDDFDPVDACKPGPEVFIEIRTVLRDDKEDTHACTLPRRVAAVVVFLAVPPQTPRLDVKNSIGRSDV